MINSYSKDAIFVSWTIDCEATQAAVDDRPLGQRSIQGYAEAIASSGLKATFFVLPADAKAYSAQLQELAKQGFEIGLHYHPQEEGYGDYCGAYTSDEQHTMYTDAIQCFADALGFEPKTFRAGSLSGMFMGTFFLASDCNPREI